MRSRTARSAQHVRGPQVFAGYLDDPALDALVFADGWDRPGDVARFGDDGELRWSDARAR